MAMGSTGIVNINTDMMDNAIAALVKYRTAATAQFEAVKKTMNTLLTPGSFAGAAADGYRDFYETNIVPLIKEQDDGQLMSLLKGFETFLTTVKQSLPAEGGGVDDQLKAQNTGAEEKKDEEEVAAEEGAEGAEATAEGEEVAEGAENAEATAEGETAEVVAEPTV